MRDKKKKTSDDFTDLEIDYGIKILENKDEMDYTEKKDHQGDIINPISIGKIKEIDKILDTKLSNGNINNMEIMFKNDEIQKLVKTDTNEFLVMFLNDNDTLIVTRVVEKINPDKIILEYTKNKYRGIIKVLDIIFKELAVKDPSLIGYKKFAYDPNDKVK